MSSDDLKMALIWRSRWWTAGLFGLPMGLFMGLFFFAENGSPLSAVFGSGFIAVFFGGAMSILMWRFWRPAGDLQPGDRAAVARIVRRGEAVTDPRLAQAIVDYAGVVRRAQDRDRRFRWVLWVFGAGTLGVALGTTFARWFEPAWVWWVLTAFWAVILPLLRRMRPRAISKASLAESSAQRLLE